MQSCFLFISGFLSLYQRGSQLINQMRPCKLMTAHWYPWWYCSVFSLLKVHYFYEHLFGKLSECECNYELHWVISDSFIKKGWCSLKQFFQMWRNPFCSIFHPITHLLQHMTEKIANKRLSPVSYCYIKNKFACSQTITYDDFCRKFEQ